MQKSEYQKLHREIWQWLADNPDKEKYDWPRWKENGGDINEKKSLCFACEYFKDCDDCELNKNEIAISGAGMCERNGVYDNWKYCPNKKTRTKLALYIKDLW